MNALRGSGGEVCEWNWPISNAKPMLNAVVTPVSKSWEIARPPFVHSVFCGDRKTKPRLDRPLSLEVVSNHLKNTRTDSRAVIRGAPLWISMR